MDIISPWSTAKLCRFKRTSSRHKKSDKMYCESYCMILFFFFLSITGRTTYAHCPQSCWRLLIFASLWANSICASIFNYWPQIVTASALSKCSISHCLHCMLYASTHFYESYRQMQRTVNRSPSQFVEK